MPEIAPRLTYSPEGVLELNKDFGEDQFGLLERQDSVFEELASLPGCSVEENGNAVKATVDIEQALSDSFNNEGDQTITEFFGLVRPFLYMDYNDPRDGVFSLDYWGQRGAGGQIYPHFQRWLNQGGPNEATARHCLETYGSAIW